MKKLSLILTLIVVFTIGTFNIASAKPGKENPGQAKKQEVTTKAKVAPGQAKKIENSKTNKRDTKVNPGQSKKVVTKKLPTVIKIGRFQLPVNPIVKDLGAEVVWPGGKVITITKDTSVITITIVADGKKSTVVEINSTVSGVAAKKVLTQKGNGVINPTSYIKSLLKVVPTPALALINAATSVQIFASVFTGNAAALTISLEGYNALDTTHQGLVAATVYNGGTDYATVAAFKAAFDAAVAAQKADQAAIAAVAAVNATTDAVACGTVVVNNATALGLTLTDYAALDSIHKTAVDTAVWNNGTDYASAAALKTAFDAAVAAQKTDQAAIAAVAVAAVNATTDAVTCGTVVVNNATALGLTLTDYAALDSTHKTAVDTAVWNSGTDYASAAALKTAFDAAVAAQKADQAAIAAAVATALVNAATSETMQSVLLVNATALGLSLTAYNALTITQAATVGPAVFTAKGTSYANAAAVKAAFDAAVTAALK